MKMLFKLMAGITTGLLLLSVLAVGGFWWMLNITADEMCGNKILSTSTMPERGVKVVVFRRDCGATTGFSTQVSILSKNEMLPNEPGNLFAADTGHGIAPKGEGGGPQVRVEVMANDGITIRHHRNARVAYRQHTLKDIAVEYEFF